MSNRVALSPAGLKIGPAGFDVLTVGEQSLLFNSDAMGMREFMRGSITISNATYKDIQFGKTFSTQPHFIYYEASGSHFYHPTLQFNTHYSTLDQEHVAFVHTSYVEITNLAGGTRTFYYLVMEPIQ